MTTDSRTRLPMIVSQPKEVTIEDRLAEAEAREDALRMVLRALTTSVRPFGLDRKRFARCIREEAESVPNEGPKAVQHGVLHVEARRVLREAR